MSAAYDRGESAAYWAVQNMSDETAARIMQGYEDGDPEILDMMPAPLSGEMPGESIAELFDLEVGADRPSDEELAAYEEDYSEGYWDTVTRACRDQLQPEDASATPGWACTDCMMLLCNGETPPGMDEEETAAFVAAFEEGCKGAHVTPGRMLGQLECDCWTWDCDTHRDVCERLEFTWQRCDICRRPNMAGGRDAVTFWSEDVGDRGAATELATLEAEFEAAGGRGVDLAERIDTLRREVHGEVGAATDATLVTIFAAIMAAWIGSQVAASVAVALGVVG